MNSFLKRVPSLGLLNFFPKSNWRIILMCLLGATTFWFFNSLNKSYTTRLNYPIQFEYDREGLIVVDELPKYLEVDVTGLGWNLLRRSVGYNTKSLIIPLENPTQTKFMLGASLRPLISQELNELEVNYIVSDSLILNIDRKISKKIVLKLDSAGIKMESNFRIGSTILIEPDSILITGPSSVIDTLRNELFFELGTGGIDETFEDDVEIMNPTRYTVISPSEVVVSFMVNEFIPITKSLNFKSKADYLFAQDSTLDINFLINNEMSDQMPDSLFVAEIDLSSWNQIDSMAKPLLTSYPEFISDIRIDSSKVKLIPR